MAEDLFSAFGIPVEGSGPLDPVDALGPVGRLAADERALRLVREAIPPSWATTINPLYANRLAEAARRRGAFRLLCARCWRPVRDHRTAVFVEDLGLAYGPDCHAGIRDRQEALKAHHGSGKPVPAEWWELGLYTCSVTGGTFTGLPDNVATCGVHPRLCAACPCTAITRRGHPCDFEMALRAGHD